MLIKNNIHYIIHKNNKYTLNYVNIGDYGEYNVEVKNVHLITISQDIKLMDIRQRYYKYDLTNYIKSNIINYTYFEETDPDMYRIVTMDLTGIWFTNAYLRDLTDIITEYKGLSGKLAHEEIIRTYMIK